MSIDSPSVAAPTTQPTNGYWDNPRAETHAIDSEADLNKNPLSEADGPQGPVLAREPDAIKNSAVSVDGGASNKSGRTETNTPDGKPIQVDPLHEGEQATIQRERTIGDDGRGGTYVSNDQLVFTTKNAGNDEVAVSQRDDGTVVVNVNGEDYDVKLAEGQELTLRVGDGDDVVEVASNVKVNLVVEGGNGADSVTSAGSGDTRIDGGDGNDSVDLSSSSGRNDVFGNTGNDGIVGGSGADILYGGDGDDVIDGGTGTNYLEGGEGSDQFDAGEGKNMVSGGKGNDNVVSGSTEGNSIYLGAGDDSVDGVQGTDKVYAESVDAVKFAAGQSDNGQVVVNVEVNPALGSSIVVEGSDTFRQRVEADLEFLRNSPVGQQMLAAIDAADPALKNPDSDHTIVIRELAREENGYASPANNSATYDDVEIKNGQPGQGTQTFMNYNPSFSMDAFPAPIVVLQHELAHDYNFATGTMQTGTYQGEGPDSGRVPNSERQAVGLETSAPAYDFDGDPSTAPTTTNPYYLTENGLRTELGLPLRESYVI